MLIIKEVVGIRRWAAIIVGFIGVYLVMDPNFKNFNIYSTFPVLCAICYAFTVVIQKKTLEHIYFFDQLLKKPLNSSLFSKKITSIKKKYLIMCVIKKI